ncbi:MAG: NUDIX hydrolase [Candidatus Marsarchaeota archaeon]|nr:NUDIX hydrolase [Candidatus Marsarchaeota archaeon]MCL5102445.1 NUDIX hydrolase [Candidatus Marsarchaeota archaeon]
METESSISDSKPKEVDVVFIALFTGDGLVYLKRREDDDIEPGKWCLPSGHVEAGEANLAAAVRELKEETGITVNGNDLEYILDFSHNLNGTDYRVWLYSMQDSNLSINDVRVFPEEHSAKRAMEIDALRSMELMRGKGEFVLTEIDARIVREQIKNLTEKYAHKTARENAQKSKIRSPVPNVD